jgi:hypothetical protein
MYKNNKVNISKDSIAEWQQSNLDNVTDNIYDEYCDTANYSDFDFVSFLAVLKTHQKLDNFAILDKDILIQLSKHNDVSSLLNDVLNFVKLDSNNLDTINNILIEIDLIKSKMMQIKLVLSNELKELKKII